MTLRTRLTLWYTAVLALVLVAFGGAVYTLLSLSLVRQIDTTLNIAADEIRLAFRRDVEGIHLPPMALDLTANVYVQVWDTEGNLIATNISVAQEPFDPDRLAEAETAYSEASYEGIHLRVLTYPLASQPEGTVVGTMQLASSLTTADDAQRALLVLLMGGGLIAVVLAALVGWTTAAAALHPLEQMTETALQITHADDLSRRIPLSGPAEGEVGRLIVAFNETLERLENLFETQRRFLADVSHELRTPLTTILGNLDLMRKMGQLDAESLDAITSETQRMKRLVQDLLVLTQAESGNLPLGKEEVELDTLVLEVFQQSKVLAKDRVEVHLGQEDQARVTGDRDRLKQVLLNLMSNAIEYTPAGGSVTLGLACVGDWARVTVTDTGPGIPQDELPHIFERFYRVDRSRKRTERGGAGLGLSIAYWITRSHDGRLEVASEVGKGTTFSVWLPQSGEGCGDASARH
ncbi:MAG: ATP-binding protein [Chloroflexi bacterium]|nr:ATP-binding protein [Chloroflexota bacterium]